MSNSGRTAERRPDGMPVGTPFEKGKSGNDAGRPKGTVSLSLRIQNIIEGKTKLPPAIDKTIKAAIGGEAIPVEAIIIAGVLQALQGDKQWAEWLSNNGYGKPKDRVEHSGDPDNPVGVTFKWQD